jgi:cytochrome P450
MSVVDETFVFDPWNVTWRDRTVETIDALVEDHPVYRTADGSYVISRYNDVREIMNRHDQYSARPNQSSLIGFPPKLDDDADPEMIGRLMAVVSALPFDVGEFAAASVIVGVDPPVHTRIRNIVNRGFVGKRIQALVPRVDAIVAECLQDLDAAKSFEVMTQLAVPVPIRVIGEILGVDRPRCDDLKRWSDVLSTCVHGETRGTIEAAIDLVQMLQEFAGLFMPMIEDRRLAPGDDLISDMVRAEEADTLSVAEAVLFLLILMAAANETTSSLIGNAVPYLCQQRDQLELLLEQPELVSGVVEETVRLAAPVQFVYREPLQDVVLNDVEIPAGSPLICFLAGANRDGRQFPDPHRFDLTRKAHHLAFGHGAHFCLGAALGRLEGRAAIQAIAPALRDFRFDDTDLSLDPSAFTRSYEVVRLERRSGS